MNSRAFAARRLLTQMAWLGGLLLAANSAIAQDSAPELELGTTSISGNRELPTVLSIVPWKRSELMDVDGRPTDSILNQALAPIDRIEARRALRLSVSSSSDPE